MRHVQAQVRSDIPAPGCLQHDDCAAVNHLPIIIALAVRHAHHVAAGSSGRPGCSRGCVLPCVPVRAPLGQGPGRAGALLCHIPRVDLQYSMVRRAAASAHSASILCCCASHHTHAAAAAVAALQLLLLTPAAQTIMPRGVSAPFCRRPHSWPRCRQTLSARLATSNQAAGFR